MVQNERSSVFVMVTCSCGRGLRAKAEQVGTEVRCWDCQKMVLVPIPHEGQRVAKELSDNALTVIKGPGLHLDLAAGAVVTAALTIPYYGVWCSAAVLALGASAYGEIIRRISRGPTESPNPGWLGSLRPRSFLKLAVGALLATGTVVPLWWLNAGLRQSPHWDGVGRAFAIAAWIIAPVLMLMLYGRTEQDTPLGVGRTLKLLARHPFATGLALAVVPITLVLVELGLVLIFFLPGNLPFFALDYMPMPVSPEPPVIYDGIPHYQLKDFRTLPASMFHQGYFDGLRHGYTFVGGFPASLSISTRADLNGNAIGLFEPLYPIVRVLFTMAIVTCLLAAFGIQARWLGSIPALERGKPGRRSSDD